MPGDSTRPIMDRVKENLFNLLGDEVGGAAWLDLFAGTGQVGIEALSRGRLRWFLWTRCVRPSRRFRRIWRKRACKTGAEVVQADAFTYLRRGDFAPV
ncbi:MAG: RsmD family RNA methyltransferase [Chloroflexi bacterium]|nr:RsmD family RNA methyltransferase [Chloroflexota bacterium]